ncbi:alpha/beta fold hydrolase [Halorarum salinum]|uniref:Alpha/beta fold hydrolase n=1 Tax=Halorarum salinum TaxID=2743089 RepID=A0A7D5LDZ2_9EURY|nr:alpha/beta hydrolase [Halobaculum salinum]QLG64274.1 alpha/beta fold hydrolase [Halobaculum salinum]
MPRADNGGVAVAYEERGRDPADAGTVVLCEGLGYGRWMWNWQADALADDYHLLLWDNRGTGDSEEPEGPYTVPELAADLEAVLADADVEEAHVVGASMGGMVAQRYAIEYDRARSLALLCTSPGGPDAHPTPESTLARMFSVPDDADEREAIRHRMAPAMSDGFPEANDALVSDVVDWRLESDASDAAREAQAAAVAAFDAGDELGSLDLPVLVAHGTADRVVPVENADLLAERLPHATVEYVEGGSHLFFVENSRRVNDLLLGFLADA